jgi:hypothetical protein
MHVLSADTISARDGRGSQILQNSDQKLPVKKAGANTTTKWSKFVKQVLAGAKVLVCYAHATGDAKFLGMLSACHS